LAPGYPSRARKKQDLAEFQPRFFQKTGLGPKTRPGGCTGSVDYPGEPPPSVGEHHFTIEPLRADHVRFTQSERFTGLLVPVLSRGLDTDTRRGFEEMNRALKDLAKRAG
jgi:hypothetical protein